MASFLEAMLGIAVFSENATLFDHAVGAWRDRAPSYFYITADGAAPPLDPQPNCQPQPHCEWYNQSVFDARVTGVCQETCRDMGHSACARGGRCGALPARSQPARCGRRRRAIPAA